MKRRKIIAAVIGLILGVLALGSWKIGLFADSPTRPSELNSREPVGFSVATYNIFYANDPAEIEGVIRAVDADVICLQETISRHQEYFEHYLNDLYPHQTKALSTSLQNGPMVLSKFPARNHRFVESADGANGFSVCEINIDDNWIQVANLHLHPIIGVGGLNRFAALDKVHQLEIEQFARMLSEGLPTLVVGDFNSFSNGAAQEYLRDHGFTDSAEDVYSMPDSHPTIEVSVIKIPVKARIDYIFRNEDVRTKALRVFEGAPSDHDGVVGIFEFVEE